jgi:GGDEF domain-containing protein
MIADALRGATKNLPFRTFIGRYGGDEFVLIAHPTAESELGSLIADIRVKIKGLCENSEAKYVLSVGVGYDEFLGGQDPFQQCLHRADKSLHRQKTPEMTAKRPFSNNKDDMPKKNKVLEKLTLSLCGIARRTNEIVTTATWRPSRVRIRRGRSQRAPEDPSC